MRTPLILAIGISIVSCSKIPHVDATSNEVDDLSIAHTNLNTETKLYTYNYVCTSDTNNLNIGGPLFSGSADVQVLTINDSIIFEKNITTVTAVDQPIWSAAGVWKVKVDFHAATGTFAMNLEPKN